MKTLQWLLPGLIACGGVLLTPPRSSAKPDYTKKEHVQCVVCHEGSWQSGKYTPAGHYYMEHRTFKGYKPAGPSAQKDKPR